MFIPLLIDLCIVQKVKVAHSIGKVEIVLEKARPGMWPNLGEALEDSGRHGC